MTMLRGTVCGMTWGWTGRRGTWDTQSAAESMEKMKELGVNWVALAFGALQERPQSTEIRYTEPPTVTDAEIRVAASRARALGLNVCLKPVVNCADGTWRAHINFFDVDTPGEPSWTQWFSSYGEFIVHYARLAEELQCEMFCVGCEMVQSDRRADQWRALIAEVRQVYTGLITYNCDKYQEDRVTWWSAVDVISASGYYPVGTWHTQLDRIEQVVEREQKPFFFMETGCPSRTGSQFMPNDWSLKGDPSEEAQDEFYEAMFTACSERPWMQGYMLWDWPARLYAEEDAHNNDDYCVYGKMASERIREYYK